jgi:hypothetical protein
MVDLPAIRGPRPGRDLPIVRRQAMGDAAAGAAAVEAQHQPRPLRRRGNRANIGAEMGEAASKAGPLGERSPGSHQRAIGEDRPARAQRRDPPARIDWIGDVAAGV